MRVLLWFISAVLLLATTDGDMKYGKQMKYEEHENDQRIVNNAIIHANKNFEGKHFDFYSILDDDHSKQMVHVLLKSTPCDKTVSGHRKDCKVSQNKPWISCVACGNDIKCVFHKETKKIEEYKKCRPTYLAGAGSTLFQEASTEQKYGCLGCI